MLFSRRVWVRAVNDVDIATDFDGFHVRLLPYAVSAGGECYTNHWHNSSTSQARYDYSLSLSLSLIEASVSLNFINRRA